MKKILIIGFMFFVVAVIAQKEKTTTLGKTTLKELKMTVYEKDSSASAVVLDEKGHVYFNLKGKNRYTKDYYVRIKILKKSAFKLATIKIPFYKSSRVKKVEAITYNLSDSGEIVKTQLKDEGVFKEKYNKSFNIKSFALPKVKVGSVIEYKFSYSRNSYSVYDWEFQSDIPKIKSTYKAYLSGRPKFKVRMIGFLKPTYETARVKKKCVGVSRCSELYYEMENVPAFYEEEYLTNKYNYLSRVTFEREYYNPHVKKGDGHDWKTLDQAFESAYRQELSLGWYYKRHLPKFLFKEKDDLQKAKNIYTYIQKRFTKDNGSDFEFKEVFDKRRGTSAQINLALFNALKAADLDVKIVFLSTRNNGFVTKLHATTEDFNYLIVKVKINGEDFFLDTTNKTIPFSLLPFECLNGEGRVFDFKKGSYWQVLRPKLKSGKSTKVAFVLKDGKLEGDINISREGYDAKFKRDELKTKNEELYLEEMESDYLNLEIDDYANEGLTDLGVPLKESIHISIDLENANTIRINPFIIDQLKINPFKLNKRLYPVDFGYERAERYLFYLTVPKGYKVKSLPKNIAVRLPNKGGSMVFSVMNKENALTLLYKFNLTKSVYASSEYNYLKEFYNKSIKIQDTFIELEKKE